MNLKTTAAAAIAAVLMAGGASASSVTPLVTVGDGDPGFIVKFGDTSFTDGGNTYENVGSIFTWALNEVTQSGTEFTYNFDLNINNTSPAGTTGPANRITAFAFGTSPPLEADDISVTYNGNTAGVTSTFTAGLNNLYELDFCVFASGKNCQSANSEFAVGGQQLDLSVALTTDGNPLDFNAFAVRMASLIGEESASAPSSASFKSTDVAVMPLPAAGWLLLAGIGGLAAFRRRKSV